MIGVLSMIILFFVVFIFYFVSYKLSGDMESSSSYECGFDINSATRLFFSYRFFLISILFLIFDVEIVLMLVVPYLSLTNKMMIFLFFFLFILLFGLLYEYYYGSLEWL